MFYSCKKDNLVVFYFFLNLLSLSFLTVPSLWQKNEGFWITFWLRSIEVFLLLAPSPFDFVIFFFFFPFFSLSWILGVCSSLWNSNAPFECGQLTLFVFNQKVNSNWNYYITTECQKATEIFGWIIVVGSPINKTRFKYKD